MFYYEQIKTNVGPCLSSFIQRRTVKGSPYTQPCKERKIKEHKAGLSAPKVAWVEQNTEQKAKPSTHAQYIGVLIIIIDIMIFQQQVPTWNDLHLHLQLATL